MDAALQLSVLHVDDEGPFLQAVDERSEGGRVVPAGFHHHAQRRVERPYLRVAGLLGVCGGGQADEQAHDDWHQTF